MARTVKKIEEDDAKKASLGVDEAENLIVEDPPADETNPTPEETAEDLKKQLKEANERTARESERRREAEEIAAKASTTAGTAIQSQVATQEAAIEGKITTAQTSLDSIKQQLKQAKAAGDSDAEVELSDALNNARYQLNAAEWEKGNFTRWKEAQLKQPISADAQKSPYTVKEQAWIDSHPEFGTSKKFSRAAKLLAQEALDEGHKQDSAGYFTYIESGLREDGFLAEEGEPLSGAGSNTNGSTSVAAAPNNAANGSVHVVNKNAKYPYIPNGFRIPAEWVQAAKDQEFEDPREYANMRLEDEANQKSRQ